MHYQTHRRGKVETDYINVATKFIFEVAQLTGHKCGYWKSDSVLRENFDLK